MIIWWLFEFLLQNGYLNIYSNQWHVCAYLLTGNFLQFHRIKTSCRKSCRFNLLLRWISIDNTAIASHWHGEIVLVAMRASATKWRFEWSPWEAPRCLLFMVRILKISFFGKLRVLLIQRIHEIAITYKPIKLRSNGLNYVQMDSKVHTTKYNF